jgi:Ca2+/Na+ antiporter
MLFYIIIFLLSSLSFIISGRLIVNGLIRVAKFLNWREFVVGFLMMSLAASLPNLFVGVSSALKGIPELSFGDVVGGNVVDLTLVAALGILLSQGIKAESRMVQMSSFFTLGAAILPLILAADGEISRIDGLVLIFAFLFYGLWLFAKEERFTKVYRNHPDNNNKAFLRHVTVNAMVIKNNQILLGLRGTLNGKPISESGKWGLLGGFFNHGENLIQAIKREVMEESGWEINNLKLFRINDNPKRPMEDRQNVDIIFIANAVKQTGVSDEEVSKLQWFDLDKIPEMAFDHGDSIELYKKYLMEKFSLPVLG